MVQVVQAFTIERRLFRPDSIPWPSMLTESGQEKLRSRYRLSQVGQEMTQVGVIGRLVSPRGEFCLDEKTYLVERLTVEPSAIEAQISASSDLADAFFEDLIRLFLELDPGAKLEASEELARTYQTIAIVKLSFPYERVLADPVRRFVDEAAVPRLSRPDAAAKVQLSNLSWLVTYETQGTEYSLRPRVLTIEPRAGTKAQDMLYYTASPTDYRGHLEILESLERIMSGTGSEPRARQARARGRKRPAQR